MDVFVARQPIFNRHQKVFAYELLFRTGTDNYYDFTDHDQATTKVISNSLLVIGLKNLTNKKRAFINFTEHLLKNGVALNLPADQVGIEILENVQPDDEVIAACEEMKRHGYLLVLDDFVIKPESRPFIKYADIIKVDFLATPAEQRRALVQALKSTGIKLLAEKVETQADFEEAVEMGYSFFQGYFFAKPVVISGKDVPSYKLTYLQLIQKVNQPEIDFDELEQVIKQDVSLSYKLLRFINSASFGVRNRIHSIKYALVLLGGKEITKWVSLIALKGMASDKPNELLVNSIIRARFCELLAPLVGLEDRSQDLFLMGMFSLIDAVMDQPLPELLAQLPIASDIKSALLGKTGPLLKVYELIQAYERADWDRLPVMGARINLDIVRLPGIYHQSLEWADEIFLG